jgi:hypothetical protein
MTRFSPRPAGFIEAEWLVVHCIAELGFLRRERIVLYYSVISDIVTDALSESPFSVFVSV